MKFCLVVLVFFLGLSISESFDEIKFESYHSDKCEGRYRAKYQDTGVCFSNGWINAIVQCNADGKKVMYQTFTDAQCVNPATNYSVATGDCRRRSAYSSEKVYCTKKKM